MTLDTFKYIAATLFCLNSWLGFYLAKHLLSDPNTQSAAKLHAGSIGVFLGVALFDMLPHATESLHAFFPDNALFITSFTCAVGFALPALLHCIPTSAKSKKVRSPLRQAQLRFLLLAFHAIIAGAALGGSDTWKEAGLLFFAILSHKALASFAFATPLYINRIPALSRLWLLILFSLATPSGIFIALLHTHASPMHTHGHIFYILLNALAAGTFIHLAIDPTHNFAHNLHHFTHKPLPEKAASQPGNGPKCAHTHGPFVSFVSGLLLIGLLSSSHTLLAQLF